MEYIRFKFKGNAVRLYPLVCIHAGAPESDGAFYEEHLKRIKADPEGYAIYMGDGGECVTKSSKGDIFEQTLTIQEQNDYCTETLGRLGKKLLFGIRGNHGHRVYKDTGMEFDKTLCARLAIPYMGISCIANLTVGRSSYDTYWHHGKGSGVSSSGKIKAAEDFAKFVNTDAIFTAHSHICSEIPPFPMYEADNDNCRVICKNRHQYVCGGSYDSTVGGYGEEKGYPPLRAALMAVEFNGKINNGHAVYSQDCRIWRRGPEGK